MAVRALGYIGIGSKDIEAWRDYAAKILGTHVDEDGARGLRLRIDSRAWRIAIEPAGEDDIIYAGWEVDGPLALAALAERLEAAGHAVSRDPVLAARRGVREVIATTDPRGLTCELFWGATERFEQPLISSTGGKGFVTGEQGLGHVVLSTMDPDAMLAFYQGVLGFGISDYIDDPRGGRITPVTFLHCNPRHHSLAFAVVPAPVKLLHFMLQCEEFDDVGLALDRVNRAGIKLSLSLGRHVNDHMVSFYAFTPGGLEVEYGWGARTIEQPHWSVVRHDSISVWGHDTINPPGTGWKYGKDA
ncbi:VOC family protein [Novosphingobium sp.]|uniref:VOC family protein n=1 Tax=Novosphingobium sp. TaxID=1874826 RepID=UPI0026182A1E|nr:VOC family protein [Novosphingobium sp.]